jgi:ribonuclease P protein component
MLPKTQRVTLPEFSRNQSSVITVRSEHFSVVTKKGKGKVFRVCVVVSKKLDKRATRRHQTKRAIIEAIRPVSPSFPQNIDCLIRVRTIVTKDKRSELCEELVTTLRKLSSTRT